ncbi:MAG: HAD family hydrolase [Promethearchaeota archaeon]
MDFERKFKENPEYYKKKLQKTQEIKLYQIKYFIFDFAGVMIESPNLISTLFEIINSDLGMNISKKDPYVSKLRRMMSSGRISSRVFLEKIFQKYCPPSEKEEECYPPKETRVDYYLDLWFNLYHQSTELYPEMEEIVRRLHEVGYTVSYYRILMIFMRKVMNLRDFSSYLTMYSFPMN